MIDHPHSLALLAPKITTDLNNNKLTLGLSRLQARNLYNSIVNQVAEYENGKAQ